MTPSVWIYDIYMNPYFGPQGEYTFFSKLVFHPDEKRVRIICIPTEFLGHMDKLILEYFLLYAGLYRGMNNVLW